MKEKLEKLRADIYDLEKTLIESNEFLLNQQEGMTNTEQNIMAEIETETDTQTMKLKFSNQEKRDRELKIRLAEMAAYNIKKNLYNQQKKKLELDKAMLQDKKLEFRSWEILSKMGI